MTDYHPLSIDDTLPEATRAKIMAQAPEWADITRSDIDTTTTGATVTVLWARRLAAQKFFTADLIADTTYTRDGNKKSTEVTIEVWAGAANRLTFIDSDHITELADQLRELADTAVIHHGRVEHVNEQ